MSHKPRACPKCGADIDYLNVVVMEYSLEDGFHEMWTATPDADTCMEFYCPECGECLAKSQDEADKLLCGGGEDLTGLSDRGGRGWLRV